MGYSKTVGPFVYLSDLHVEGLFRVPGNSIRQQALREMLNSGADVDLDTGDYHPRDAATLLKAFLGELPEPLLTQRHYQAHLKIAGTPSWDHSLPQDNFRALRSDTHVWALGMSTFISLN